MEKLKQGLHRCHDAQRIEEDFIPYLTI